jgi:hypothetical protein
MSSPPNLEKYEQAIIQIMLNAKVVESTKMEKYLEQIKRDFMSDSDDYPHTLHDSFKRINNNLKKFSFEIKTLLVVEQKGDDGANVRVHYHVLANTEADKVAIECGASLTESEVVVFKNILDMLLEKNYENTEALVTCKADKWTDHQMESYLSRLQRDGWLSSDSRGFWVIGPRAHVELRTMLEATLVDNIQHDEDEDQDLYAAKRTECLNRLPQMKFY